MQNLPIELENWINDKLLDVLPIAVAAIDWDSNIVYANRPFEQRFGAWQNRKCYQVYKNQELDDSYCKVPEAFKDGKTRTTEDSGYDINGQLTKFTKHTIPIIGSNGTVLYLFEMFTDITETEKIRREYQLLFDQVPCNVLIIDREFRIVKTNQRLQTMLGDLQGGYCYSALKGFDHKCAECTARQTFEDGQLHTGHHIWSSKTGKTLHLHVITVPLRHENGEFDTVMELAVDVSNTVKLEESLRFAHSFLETMVTTSMDGIFAVNEKGKVTVFNPAARKLFGVKRHQVIAREELAGMLPKGFLAQVSDAPKHLYLPETTIKTLAGISIPVRLVGTPLSDNSKPMGMAFSVQDLQEIKQLQNEKLEAERLAVVGQTVAGLAHGIKNLIIALEGGMYMLSSGIQKGNIERVQKGINMLNRNIERIATSVKTFLRFARGREIRAKLNDPAEISAEVVEMYAPKAAELGIELIHEIREKIRPVPIDYESMHECLTNIVGNSLDACNMADNKEGHHVWVRTYEENGAVVFEVEDDGVGMDPEVQQKVFTTIFTTKGLGGTGLGLLMTNKIIQDHGGKIFIQSESGEGTTFRIILPRLRLPKVAAEVEHSD